MFIYDRFESRRKEIGVTKAAIAVELGRKQSIFQDWKKHKSEPSQEQLEIVARKIMTTVDYLCGLTDEKEPATYLVGGLPEAGVSLLKLLRTFSESDQRVLYEQLYSQALFYKEILSARE